MTYPGNPALPQDTRERISATFDQTKGLVDAGSAQEALAGCEFILHLDPLFSPARVLAEQLRGSSNAPDVADDATREALRDLEDFEDLDGLGELGLEDDPPEPRSGFARMIADLLAKREFERIVQISESQKEAVAADAEVQHMVAEARDRFESDAFMRSFLAQARTARDSGSSDEAAAALRRARELDPDHPELLAFYSDTESEDELELDGSAEVFVPPDVAAESLDDTRPVGLVGDSDTGIEDEVPASAGDKVLIDGLDEFGLESESPDEPSGSLLDQLSDDEFPSGGEDDVVADDELEEEGDRVAQLIEEGRAAFDAEEFQAAIDVWSRIFLIDIDNQDAKALIEEARKKKAELERKGEEIFHQGVADLDEGSLDQAAEHFRTVLEAQPSHALAREYLDQLEAGRVPKIKRSVESEEPDDLDGMMLGEDAELGSGPSLEAAVERDRLVVVKKTDRKLIALGAAVLIAVAALGSFVVTSWDDLFPNAESSEVPGQRRVDAVARATKMHETGSTENAILVLERISAEDPQYEQAQALIDQWRALIETVPVEEESGLPPQDQARVALLLDAARTAHADHHFIRSRRYFERAEKLAPLAAEDLGLKRDCEQNLKHLSDYIRGFETGEYTQIIPMLWRMRETRPDDRDIQLLIVDSYYNLAITDLQRGDPGDAAVKLKDALEVDPAGRDLERLHMLAQTYVDRDQDLLYRIFVKYLPSR